MPDVPARSEIEERNRKSLLARKLRKAGLDASEEEAFDQFEDWRQIRRLWGYIRPRKGRVAIAVVGSIVLSTLLLVPAVLTQYIVDHEIAAGHMQGVFRLCMAIVFVQFLIFALEAFTTHFINRIGQESMRDLRMDLFRHLEKQPLRYFDKNPVGWMVTRMTSDVNVLNELFAQGVVGIFQQIFMLIAIVVVLFFYNWELALATMVVVPLVLLLSWQFRKRIKLSYRLTRLRLSRMNTHVQENVTGMKTVHANTREDRQYGLFEKLNDHHRDAHYRTVFAFAMYFPLIEVLAATALAIIVWQGGSQYLQERITLGELILFVSLLERFFHPIRDLSEKFNLVQSAIAASERLFKILDTKPTIEDPEKPRVVDAFQGTIEFRDVWFAYNDEDWVLKGVSFTVEKGQSVAIVGPTGSGKTTLMALLCRFYDIQKGAILIDGIDIREMRQADLRRRIALVMQDVFLFKGSVADNIRLGEERIGDEEVHRAAEAVSARGFIERLPHGFDSDVRERGATLSVGQKQLLSFARALAFDPEILILDEATSSIDTETERAIQHALEELTQGRTSMIIAHRLSTIQSADKILVIHHGHLAEEGSHRELLARDGLYRRLYDLQYREQAAG